MIQKTHPLLAPPESKTALIPRAPNYFLKRLTPVDILVLRELVSVLLELASVLLELDSALRELISVLRELISALRELISALRELRGWVLRGADLDERISTGCLGGCPEAGACAQPVSRRSYEVAIANSSRGTYCSSNGSSEMKVVQVVVVVLVVVVVVAVVGH